MKLFTRTKFIGPLGLIMATVGVGGGTAIAAEPSGAEPSGAERASKEAPSQCPGLEEGAEGSEATLDGNARGAEAQESEAQPDPTGPLALVGYALQKVCLSDEQRDAIEKLGDRVRPKEEAVMRARHALRKALLEQLESGRIDEHALRGEVDDLVKAREEASPALREALEELHGVLDSGQREAFVDALESKMKELKEGAEGWRDQLAKDLGLSDEQRQHIDALIAKAQPQLHEERARAKKVFDSFEKDDFSIERVAPVGDVGERTRARAEGMIGIAKELVDILTPEQRDVLVKKIEGRRSKHGHGGQGATTSAASDGEDVDVTEQPLVAVRGGGFRAGGVGGWGYARGGYAGGVGYGGVYRGGYVGGGYGGGYVARGATVTTGYAAGYPLAAGYGPGIW